MSWTAKAVVCREVNKPVTVEEIQVESPRRDEITIKLAACGVCHSDLSATNGTLRLPPPLILGHEGAGVVVEVGEGVTQFKPGDCVLSTFVRMCGKCGPCSKGRPVLCEHAKDSLFTMPDGSVRTKDANGNPLNIFCGVGVMAEYATIHVDSAIKIDNDLPLKSAALVGCAVMTGVGAVINTAAVEPGSSVAVFGIGGVGLNAVQGARLAGADSIIAVDTNPGKLAMAREFGATDVIDASQEDVVKALRGRGGVDYAFECVGSGALVGQAYKSLARGGTVVVVGVAPPEDQTSFGTLAMPADERCIRGSWYGSARPQHDFPRLLSLYRHGQLKLDELVTRTYTIDEGPQAFADLESGLNARGVIVFD